MVFANLKKLYKRKIDWANNFGTFVKDSEKFCWRIYRNFDEGAKTKKKNAKYRFK